MKYWLVDAQFHSRDHALKTQASAAKVNWGRKGNSQISYQLVILSLNDALPLTQNYLKASVNYVRELRITDPDKIWRIIYRLDVDAVVLGDVFCKKTESTPAKVIANSRLWFKQYDAIMRQK